MLDSSLQQIISKMVIQLTNSNELESFRNVFEKRKIYNEREKSYIQNEKIKKQLGADYDSEESDDDDAISQFGSFTKYQMKCMLKENLIKNNFDEDKLSYIEPPTPEQQPSDRDYYDHCSTQNYDQTTIANKSTLLNKEDLKVIQQKRELNILGRKNLWALDFVIKELQKVVDS